MQSVSWWANRQAQVAIKVIMSTPLLKAVALGLRILINSVCLQFTLFLFSYLNVHWKHKVRCFFKNPVILLYFMVIYWSLKNLSPLCKIFTYIPIDFQMMYFFIVLSKSGNPQAIQASALGHYMTCLGWGFSFQLCGISVIVWSVISEGWWWRRWIPWEPTKENLVKSILEIFRSIYTCCRISLQIQWPILFTFQIFHFYIPFQVPSFPYFVQCCWGV